MRTAWPVPFCSSWTTATARPGRSRRDARRPARGRGRRRPRAARAPGRAAAATHVAEQRAAADRVQDLGGGRLHPGALTRGEDDDGSRAVGAHGEAPRRRMVDTRRIPTRFVRAGSSPPPGLEPGLKAPKAPVLPITPRRINSAAADRGRAVPCRRPRHAAPGRVDAPRCILGSDRRRRRADPDSATRVVLLPRRAPLQYSREARTVTGVTPPYSLEVPAGSPAPPTHRGTP